MKLSHATVRLASVALFLLLVSSPGLAASKDMVQLQTQIQQLQDAVARLQQSNDERMGVLKDLVQQSADSVNKMSLNMDALQKQMRAQQEAQGGKLDQVSGQIQALNDTLDEIKARMNRLDKTLQDIQGQQQSLAAGTNASPAASGSAPPPAMDTPAPSTPAPAPTTPGKRPKGSAAILPPMAPTTSAAQGAPPIDELYKTALSDYMAAKYPLSTSEFEDVIKFYPDNSLSGNAFYYLGEIEYRAGHYSAAAKDYDKVLEQYPDNNKIPASHLHKGQALIALKETDAGVRELRSLIQRFPNSPEAVQARSKLSGMGIPATARR